MKAAVCYGYGQPLVIEEVDIDPPEKGEVKIRIGATAICHSDIHDLKGEHGQAVFPATGGHEVAGYVEEIGEGVTYVEPGDHVMVSKVMTGCGKGYSCLKGHPMLCEKNTGPRRPISEFTGLSAPGRFVNMKGQRITQLSGPEIAGFVEYAVVPEETLVKIPEDMPVECAALMACGVVSGFGAVFHHAHVKPLSSVVVIGCGGVGLNVIQSARLAGAYPIIAVDIQDNKLATAHDFGATHTVNSKKEKDPIEAVYGLTGGRGADYVFIVVAGVDILRQGYMMSTFRGMTVILGHGINEPMSAFQPVDFVATDRIITGCAMGGTQFNSRVDFPRIIELYQAGRLKLDELITGRYKLEQINEAIASVERGEALRNVIIF